MNIYTGVDGTNLIDCLNKKARERDLQDGGLELFCAPKLGSLEGVKGST